MNTIEIQDKKLQDDVFNALREECEYSSEARAACEIFDSIMIDGEFNDEPSKDLVIIFLEKKLYNANEADQHFQARKIEHLIERVEAAPVRSDDPQD